MTGWLRGIGQAIGRAYGRYATAALTRPGRFALALALCCAPAIWLDAQFFSRVRTELKDLLPPDAASVRAIDQIHDRLGDQSHLNVIAHGPDVEQNRAFIRELGETLAARKLPAIRSLQWNVDLERRWIEAHGALLLPRADFDEVERALDADVHAAKERDNPLNLDLGAEGDGAAEGAASRARWENIEQRLRTRGAVEDRFPNGYLELLEPPSTDHRPLHPPGSLVVLAIWLNGSALDPAIAEALEHDVREAATPILTRYPHVQMAFNGEVTNIVEEHHAVLADLSLSSLLVFVLVGALIVGYFRSLRAVLAVTFALIPGLCLTFALGRLTVGSLNSNTAFLGSIIAGNGINYPLLLLAYYRADAPSLPRERSYLMAALQALPGTLGAAATASAAYGGLSAAQFRGFSEFGWLGGLGMLTTWVCTFLAMPIAIGLFDPPRRPAVREALSWYASRFYENQSLPRILAGVFAALALGLSGLGVYRAVTGGVYEMDINALRNRESLRSGGSSWDHKMSELFGVWMNPVAALVDDPAKREAAAQALRGPLFAGDPAPAERIETIETVVPALGEQERRLAVLRRAKRLLGGTATADIPERARPYVDRWLSDDNLRPVALADVPKVLRQAFTEVNGRADEVVLVYPSLKIDYNDARNVLRFADALQSARLPPDTVAGGSFLFMAEIIRLVQDEAPLIILVVCLLVALALVPIFVGKPLRILACVLTIAMVALCAQAIMLALGVRVNMFNFAAVPITIGVGSDYIVNLFGAMDAFHADPRRAAAQMGGAILLCSLTTVVGYLSLVFAQSGALRTFGWAAVLGEIMAVTTVLLVVPALVSTRRRMPQSIARAA